MVKLKVIRSGIDHRACKRLLPITRAPKHFSAPTRIPSVLIIEPSLTSLFLKIQDDADPDDKPEEKAGVGETKDSAGNDQCKTDLVPQQPPLRARCPGKTCRRVAREGTRRRAALAGLGHSCDARKGFGAHQLSPRALKLAHSKGKRKEFQATGGEQIVRSFSQ